MVYKHNEDNAARLRKKFEIEEQNMFYLRHSFLTPVSSLFRAFCKVETNCDQKQEQENGYAKELGKRENWLAEKQNLRLTRPYRPHVTLEERLSGPLIVANKWD